MKKGLMPLFIVLTFIALAVVVMLTGCATEYYEPKDNNIVKADNKLYGPVKREGFVPWSDGVGKNLPLSNPSFSVVGK